MSWEGSLGLPGVITYDGTLAYQGKAREVKDSKNNSSEIYYDYLDIKFDGEINTVANKENNNKGLKIVADNLEINAQRRKKQFELDRISLAGYFADKPQTSLWSGNLNANFVGKASEALITDFNFKGMVKHVNYADLKIDLNPKLTYDKKGELTKILSNIKVSRGDAYLDGRVDATPTVLKVNLTNQDGYEFKMVADDDKQGNVVAEKSYIKNSQGKTIAKIDSDGLIYYSDEDEEKGEIGSLY